MKFRHIATAITTLVALTSGTAALAQDSSLAAFDARLARESMSTLTRADVLADLKLYRASGLLDLQRSEAPDAASTQFQQAQAKYAQLNAAKSLNTGKASPSVTRARSDFPI